MSDRCATSASGIRLRLGGAFPPANAVLIGRLDSAGGLRPTYRDRNPTPLAMWGAAHRVGEGPITQTYHCFDDGDTHRVSRPALAGTVVYAWACQRGSRAVSGAPRRGPITTLRCQARRGRAPARVMAREHGARDGRPSSGWVFVRGRRTHDQPQLPSRRRRRAGTLKVPHRELWLTSRPPASN